MDVKTTWIVVAHRGDARIYELRGFRDGLKLVYDMAHPEGRLKNGEIDTDRPGRSMGYSSHRNPYTSHQDSVQRVAQTFGNEIGQYLDRARMDHRFEQLMIVAEPSFLGVLRGALNSQLESMVVATLDKNLAHCNERELPEYVYEPLKTINKVA